MLFIRSEFCTPDQSRSSYLSEGLHIVLKLVKESDSTSNSPVSFCLTASRIAPSSALELELRAELSARPTCTSRRDSVRACTKGKEEKSANLVVDHLIEEAAAEGLLLEPPVQGPVGDVGIISRANTTGEQGDDAAGSVKDDSVRVSWGGGGAAPLIIWQESGFDGCALDAAFLIDGRERVQPVLSEFSAQPYDQNVSCLLGPATNT